MVEVVENIEAPIPPMQEDIDNTNKSTGTTDEDYELSPIEQVRLTVSNTDDPTLPVWTFRMWVLGLISCVLLSFLNQFFSYRREPLIITQITVVVATLPIGRFMAAALPTTQFRIPGFGSRKFSLNPGPFNIKEHVLISIFANAGTAFGNGSAYAVGIVNIIIAFYGRKISFIASWLLIITTQVGVFYPYAFIVLNLYIGSFVYYPNEKYIAMILGGFKNKMSNIFNLYIISSW